MNKKYIRNIIAGTLFLLTCVAFLNFVVDPGSIYLKKIMQQQKITQYVDELLKSQNGVVQESWNERLVKIELAKYSNSYDCIIMGSSHIMQISTITNHGTIGAQCSSLLNLGVSGGSLEDFSIFSYIISTQENLPKKVFVDISPWMFKFDIDDRYKANIGYHNSMLELLGVKSVNYVDELKYYYKISKNLINYEYSKRTLKDIVNNFGKNNNVKSNEIVLVPKFNLEQGYINAVTLPDGSHSYGLEYIQNGKNRHGRIGTENPNYKITENPIDEKAVRYFVQIIKLLQNKGINVNFILMLYHPDVFVNSNSMLLKNMKDVQDVVGQLSQTYNIKIYGSFNPNDLNCNADDFYDFMHVNWGCLDKIKFKD